VFGDHGGVLPGSKGYLYETGLHVPLVVYVPEAFRHLSPFAAGSRPEMFARFMDFGPTVLRLAGLDVPPAMDGRPFLGQDVEVIPPARDTVYSYADRFDAKADFVRAVRIGDYKYIRSYQPYLPDGLYNDYRYRMWAYRDWYEGFRAGTLDSLQARFFRARPAEMLFNVAEDPFETTNLASRPDLQPTLRALRTALQQKVDELPDLSFIPESIFLEKGVDDPLTFGITHQDRILRLRKIADLQLLPHSDQRQQQLWQALTSTDPLDRYWALVVLSSSAELDEAFLQWARVLAEVDDELLVRLRATEFLGLVGEIDPRRRLIRLLHETDSPTEAATVINTMSLFRFLHPEWEWELEEGVIPRSWRFDENGNMQSAERLLRYLRGEGNI
jgi:hypothetical protein